MAVDVQHLMIPTRDGTRLSANLLRPVTDRPAPASSNTPPTARTISAARDFGHFYFAERGIASVQLDVRGIDEYLYPQEQQDGCDALEWLAQQEWYNGKTGLWGTSYAALQIDRADRAAVARGDRAALRDRRPLYRRHALPGRGPGWLGHQLVRAGWGW